MTDILWRNSTGDNAMWLMNGVNYGSYAGLNPVDTSWKIRGVGDFNNDGKSDILWRNTSTGQNAIWLMNGSVFGSYVGLNSVDTSWDIKGVGDFNGDGKADILWRKNTGENGIWLMNGGTYSGYAGLNSVDTSWDIKAVADFNGDGKTDILWRNKNSGQNGIWSMNGSTYSGYTGLNSVDTSWDIKAAGDFNGDGKTDILWRKNTGENGIWLMNQSVFSSYVGLNSVSTNWDIVGVGNFSSGSSGGGGGSTGSVNDTNGNDTEASATNLGTLNGTVSGQGSIGANYDYVDWYRFSVNNVSTFSLSLSGLSQNLNVYMYNSKGEVITSSTNFSSDPESINGVLESGTYYVQIFPSGGILAFTNYNLSLSATPTTIGPDAAGNTIANARDTGSLNGIVSYRDFVGITDYYDYYRFSLASSRNVSLSLTGLSQDADLWLYDSSGSSITFSSSSGTTQEQINRFLSAGTYYVRVSTTSFTFSGNTTYNLSLNG